MCGARALALDVLRALDHVEPVLDLGRTRRRLAEFGAEEADDERGRVDDGFQGLLQLEAQRHVEGVEERDAVPVGPFELGQVVDDLPLHVDLALGLEQGEDEADRRLAGRHPDVMVVRVHARVRLVDDLALVGDQQALDAVVRVDHVVVEAHLAFLGREPDLSDTLVLGDRELLDRAGGSGDGSGEEFREPKVVVQGVVTAHLVVEVVEMLPRFAGELGREALFRGADRQGRRRSGNRQEPRQRVVCRAHRVPRIRCPIRGQ